MERWQVGLLTFDEGTKKPLTSRHRPLTNWVTLNETFDLLVPQLAQQ